MIYYTSNDVVRFPTCCPGCAFALCMDVGWSGWNGFGRIDLKDPFAHCPIPSPDDTRLTPAELDVFDAIKRMFDTGTEMIFASFHGENVVLLLEPHVEAERRGTTSVDVPLHNRARLVVVL